MTLMTGRGRMSAVPSLFFILLGSFFLASPVFAKLSLTEGELAQLQGLKAKFEEGGRLEEKVRANRDKALGPLEAELKAATTEAERAKVLKKIAQVEDVYMIASRKLVAEYRQPLVDRIQRIAGLEGSVGTELFVKNPETGRMELNPKHRGWSGDVDLRGSARNVSDMRDVLETLDIKVEGAQGKGGDGKTTGGDVSTSHDGKKPGLELTANIDDMSRRGTQKTVGQYESDVDRLQADVKAKEAALKDKSLDKQKRAELEADLAQAKRDRDRAALDLNAAKKNQLITPGKPGPKTDIVIDDGNRLGKKLPVVGGVPDQGRSYIPEDGMKKPTPVKQPPIELKPKTGIGGRDTFEQVGSSAHADKIGVDAKSKETYVSVGMKDGQAGKTAVEIEDHYKKAAEGLKTPAKDLLKPENSDKLQGLAKGAKKSLESTGLDDKVIEAALKKAGSQMSVDDYKAELNNLKEGKSYKGRDGIDSFQKATEAVLDAARNKAGAQADAELKSQQEKVRQLDAEAKNLSGKDLEANRRAREQTATELIDSKTRLDATRSANDERVGSSKKPSPTGGDDRYKTAVQPDVDADGASRADKLGKVASGLGTAVAIGGAVDTARQVVDESKGDESDAQLVGKVVGKTMEGLLDIENKRRIIQEEMDASGKSGLTGEDGVIRDILGGGVAAGRIVVDELKGKFVDPVLNTGTAIHEGKELVKDWKEQERSEQNLEDFRNSGPRKEGGLTGREALDRAERKIMLDNGNIDVLLAKLSGDMKGDKDAYKDAELTTDDGERLNLIKQIRGDAERQVAEIQKALERNDLSQADYKEAMKRLDTLGNQLAQVKAGLKGDVGNKGASNNAKRTEDINIGDVGDNIKALQKKAERDAYNKRYAAEEAKRTAEGKAWEEKQKRQEAEARDREEKAAADAERRQREKEEREARAAEEAEAKRKAALPSCDKVDIGVECNEPETPGEGDDGRAPELKGDCPEGFRLDVRWEMRGKKNVAVAGECVPDMGYTGKGDKPKPGEAPDLPADEPAKEDGPEPWEAEWQANYDAYHAELDKQAEDKKRAREERSERCKNTDCYELPGYKLDVPEAVDSSWAVVFALNKPYATSMRGIYYDLDGRRQAIERERVVVAKKSKGVVETCGRIPPVPVTKNLQQKNPPFGGTITVTDRGAVAQQLIELNALKYKFKGADREIAEYLKAADKLRQLVESYNKSVQNNSQHLQIINNSLEFLLPASTKKYEPIEAVSVAELSEAASCERLGDFLEQVDEGISGANLLQKKDAALAALASQVGGRLAELKGGLGSVSDEELMARAKQIGLDSRSSELGSLIKARQSLQSQLSDAPPGAWAQAFTDTYDKAVKAIQLADKLYESMGKPLREETVRRLLAKIDTLTDSVPEKLDEAKHGDLARRHQEIYKSALFKFVEGTEDANDVMAAFQKLIDRMNDARRADSMAKAKPQGPGEPGKAQPQQQLQAVVAGRRSGAPMRSVDVTESFMGGAMEAPDKPQMGAMLVGGRRAPARKNDDVPDEGMGGAMEAAAKPQMEGVATVGRRAPAGQKVDVFDERMGGDTEAADEALKPAVMPPARGAIQKGGGPAPASMAEELKRSVADALDDLRDVKSSMLATPPGQDYEAQLQEYAERAKEIVAKANEVYRAAGVKTSASLDPSVRALLTEIETLAKGGMGGAASPTATDPKIMEEIRQLYQKFAAAFANKDLAGVLDLLTEDWESSEGVGLSDMERTLGNSFSVFDSVQMTVQSLQIMPKGKGTYLAVYSTKLTGTIRANDIQHEETSTHQDTVVMTPQGPKISRTSGSTAWVQ